MNEKSPRLLIIRGIPGSGKSTLAKKLSEKYHIDHFENDQFLLDDNGKYVWTPQGAKDAAKKCFNSVMNTLKAGNDCIVSNVFVTINSINKYINTAKQLGAKVKVLRKTSQYQNVHDVPLHVLTSMKLQFQDYPGEEIIT